MVYQFDAVFDDEIKKCVADLWNKRESANCKIIISNNDEKTMKKLGFKNIILKEKITMPLKTSGNEQRTCYIYARKGYTQLRYMCDMKREDIKESLIFKEAFDLWKEGDDEALTLSTGYKMNLKLIKANLTVDPSAKLPKVNERTRRSRFDTLSEKGMAGGAPFDNSVPQSVSLSDDSSTMSSLTEPTL